MEALTYDVETAARKIYNLDLGPIKVKLMDSEDGAGWTRKQCDVVEKWYKRYLILTAKHPALSLVPNKEIDEFWHQHILDTMKYAEDCEEIFGHFLHHFPYFGMRGEQDAKRMAESFQVTLDLYVEEFQETLSAMHADFPDGYGSNGSKCDGSNCSAKDCSKCGKSCSGGKCKGISKDFVRPTLAD